jgi:transposase-like protein
MGRPVVTADERDRVALAVLRGRTSVSEAARLCGRSEKTVLGWTKRIQSDVGDRPIGGVVLEHQARGGASMPGVYEPGTTPAELYVQLRAPGDRELVITVQQRRP